ncbi:MAG: GDSL-type esterase/lipase family protein [Bryobacteraceae bacterium]
MVLRIAAALIGSALLNAQPIVVAFGDSLTAPRKGVITYSDVLKIVNRGVGGNNTDQARARFEKDVLAAHPNLVIIQLGTNDAAVDVWKKPPATEPRVAVARYRENMQYFIDALRSIKAKVILMTPNRMAWTPKLRELYGRPPYDTASDDGFNLLLDLYSDVLRGIALRENIPLVDAAKIVRPEHLLDGMHPSTEGHRLVAEALRPILQRELNLP